MIYKKGIGDSNSNPFLVSLIFPIAWDPDPLPPTGSPPIFPVARDPNSIRLIIIGRVITGGRIVPSVINRRGSYPDRRRSKKDPEMAAMVSTPG